MLPRLLLLLSSYSPLPLLIGIRDYNSGQMWVLFALAALFALALPALWLAKRRTTERAQRVITEVSSDGDEVAGYLMSYILPFVSLSQPTGRDLIAFAVFGLFLLAAYLQAGRVPVNPWLLLVRARTWRIGTGTDNFMLLARTEPVPGDVFKAVRVTQGLYVGSRNDD